MLRRILIVLLSAAMMTGVSTALNTTPTDESQELVLSSSETALIDDPSGNSSYYLKLIKGVRDQYNEDLAYSSDILDDFIKNNITNSEAMVATASVLTLTTQTYDTIDQVELPEEYVMYQYYMRYALIYLKGYLWNMAKFYETNKNDYAVQARENFNLSIYYYEKSIEEYESIQRSAVGS